MTASRPPSPSSEQGTSSPRATGVRRFPPVPASVAAARRFVDGLLSGSDPELCERAVLIVSELATNALRHVGSAFTVELDAGSASTYLAVADESPVPPRPRTPEPTETGGRGMQIVDAVADDWGVDARAAGKIVWCRLDASGSGAARPVRG